jgi:hypothetical protein
VIDTRWGGTDIGRVSVSDELDQHVRGRPRIAFHSSSYYYQISETIRTLVVAQIVDFVLVNMFGFGNKNNNVRVVVPTFFCTSTNTNKRQKIPKVVATVMKIILQECSSSWSPGGSTSWGRLLMFCWYPAMTEKRRHSQLITVSLFSSPGCSTKRCQDVNGEGLVLPCTQLSIASHSQTIECNSLP